MRILTLTAGAGGMYCGTRDQPVPHEETGSVTARFQQVLDHYGLRSSRIQPGKPHENGVAEQAHFQTKTAIEQALLLRGDRDFVDEAARRRCGPAIWRALQGPPVRPIRRDPSPGTTGSRSTAAAPLRPPGA